ncbi:MAG: putative DCC family thiol-disulfide oxidoreductase YuxK [Chlamydiales bacterium]|jgi:predicted DCC family thiol-disulfide oxidoreductase YuxK
MSHKHLVFYDGNCPLCNIVVRFLLKVDKEACFFFAPLEGETAILELKDTPDLISDLDTMVFLENYETPDQILHLKGKAALRIAWHLGGVWKMIGWLSFIPSFPFDIVYRLIAKNRYRLFSSKEPLPKGSYENRFLP